MVHKSWKYVSSPWGKNMFSCIQLTSHKNLGSSLGKCTVLFFNETKWVSIKKNIHRSDLFSGLMEPWKVQVSSPPSPLWGIALDLLRAALTSAVCVHDFAFLFFVWASLDRIHSSWWLGDAVGWSDYWVAPWGWVYVARGLWLPPPPRVIVL